MSSSDAGKNTFHCPPSKIQRKNDAETPSGSMTVDFVGTTQRSPPSTSILVTSNRLGGNGLVKTREQARISAFSNVFVKDEPEGTKSSSSLSEAGQFVTAPDRMSAIRASSECNRFVAPAISSSFAWYRLVKLVATTKLSFPDRTPWQYRTESLPDRLEHLYAAEECCIGSSGQEVSHRRGLKS